MPGTTATRAASREELGHVGRGREPTPRARHAPPEEPRHVGEGMEGARQRLHRGPRRDRGGIRRDLTLDVGHGPDELAWPSCIADPPPGHRVGFRARVDGHRTRLDLGPELRHGDVRPVEGQSLVTLGDSAPLGVPGPATPERGLRGRLDALRRVEVGLPRAEGDHVHPPGAQRPGAALHRQGGGGGQVLHAGSEHARSRGLAHAGDFGGNFSSSRFSTTGGTSPATEAP